MLLYAFEQLSLLRKDDPNAWLLVNELYEDDLAFFPHCPLHPGVIQYRYGLGSTPCSEL